MNWSIFYESNSFSEKKNLAKLCPTPILPHQSITACSNLFNLKQAQPLKG